MSGCHLSFKQVKSLVITGTCAVVEAKRADNVTDTVAGF